MSLYCPALIPDVVVRFSLVESLILDYWNVNSGISSFWLKISVSFQRDRYYAVINNNLCFFFLEDI